MLSSNAVIITIASFLAFVLYRFVYQPLYAIPLGQVPGSKLFSALHLLIIVESESKPFILYISNTLLSCASVPTKYPSPL